MMNRNADLILEMIVGSSEHMTAEEIHAALRNGGHRMAPATVYNNLARLHSEGRIRKVCVEGQPDRYDKTTRHDHLVCLRCGKLTDICFRDLTQLLQSQTDEALLSYDLQVHYICPACRRTAHPAGTADP